ncbi:MAG: CYTH domain-containing protein [Candidatus Pacebacteria bacterium]|nr:CYTH domain-containing protein [Candidatus Paceibacterota bacterium]
MSSYEIEIKSLLGSKDKADALRNKIVKKFGPQSADKSKQLNHYFIGSDMAKFKKNFSNKIVKNKLAVFEKIVDHGKKISVRTRRTDKDTILVVKASIDDTTSSNGISRMEFEQKLPMTLDELDKLLLDSGFQYQAKWSREREEYSLPDLHICIDKNAGYGYLAEFEKVVGDEKESDGAQKMLRSLMQEFDAEELKQDRLERMFAHYNANWEKYYGTDNIFNIQ